MKIAYLFSEIHYFYFVKKFIFFLTAILICSTPRVSSQTGWIQQTSPISDNLVSVSFINEYTGYACGQRKIIKTTNGGFSWFIFDSTSANYDYSKIKFLNQNTGIVQRTGNFRTTDGGLSWADMGQYFTDFGFVDSAFGWGYGINSLSMSNDYGNTWYSGGAFYPSLHGSLGTRNFGIATGSFDDFMHNKLYMYIYRSFDGGMSWNCLSGGVYGDPCAYEVVYGFMPPLPYRKSYVVDDYVAFLYGGTRNMRTNNSGDSWTSMNIGNSIAGFDFMNHNTGYAVGGNGLIQYTTSSGVTWYQQATPVSVQLNAIDMVSSTIGWAVGGSGVILKTGSGGLALPLAPSLVSPANNSTGVQLTAHLEWDDILQAVNYRLQISTDANFITNLVDNNTLLLSQFDIPPGILAANTVYYWRVSAKNYLDWGSFSQTWNFRTHFLPDIVNLASPLNNSTEQPTNLTCRWYDAIETLSKQDLILPELENTLVKPDIFDISEGIDAIDKYWFELVADTVSLAGMVRDSTLNDTSKFVSGLAAGTKYFWRVKARNILGWGPFSKWWNFTTVIGPPQAPVLNNPVNFSIQQHLNIPFKWYKSVEITAVPINNNDKNLKLPSTSFESGDAIIGYWFEITEDTIGYSGIIRDTALTDTIKVLSLPDVSKSYYWRVKGKNSSGWGTFSKWGKFITKPEQNSWYLVADEISPGIRSVTFANAETGYLCAYQGGFGFIYKTTDGGNNWINAYSEMYMFPQSIAFSGTEYGVIAAGPYSTTNYPIWFSFNGGFSWNSIAYTDYQSADIRSVTNQNGSFWSVGRFTTFGNPQLTYSAIVENLGTVHPLYHTIPLNRIRSGKNLAWTVGAQGIIYKGLTQLTVGNSSANLTGVSFNDENTGYVVGGPYMYKSSNAGSNWFRIYPMDTLINYNDVYFANKDTGWVACTLPQEGAILATVNGGINWVIQYIGIYSGSEFTFANNSTGWLLCGNSLLKTGTGFIPPVIYPPVLISPYDGSTGVLLTTVLDWNNVSSASRYRIQVSAQSNFSSSLIDDSTISASQYSISSGILSPATTYFWRVAAGNDTVWSQFSGAWNFTTLGMPLQVVLSNPLHNSTDLPIDITFSWNHALETLLNSDNVTMLRKQSNQIEGNKEILIKEKSETDAIVNYWFELTSDTVSLAGLIRDSLLTDTLKVVNGLDYSTSYYWRVKAKNEIGWGPFSSWWKFTTVIAVPLAPVLYSPLDNSTGNSIDIDLVWYKSATAASYRLQLATDSLFSNIVVNDSTLNDSVKTVSGLNPLTNYWWRVNAGNAGGTSNYSSVWKFKTIGTPGQVSLVSPPNNSVNQPLSVVFIWSKAYELMSPLENKNSKKYSNNKDAITNYGFELVTDTVSMTNLLKDTTLTDTLRTVNNLINQTNYYWRVKAKGELGWGNYSVWFKFTTIIAAPPAPLLVSPVNNAVGQDIDLTFVWNKLPVADSYRLHVSTDSLFNNLIVNDSLLTDTTRTVTGLNPLTFYWWRVNAKNIGGTGIYSEVRKFKTMGAPTQVILLSPPNNSVDQTLNLNFVWRNSTDMLAPWMNEINKGKESKDFGSVNSYWFELVADTLGMTGLLRDTAIADTTKFVGGLSYSTVYFWRVKARNQIGWGIFSTWFKFTTMPPPPAMVTLAVIPGGFFNSTSSQLNMKDTIRVYLVDSATCQKVDSATGIVDSVTFSVSISFSHAQSGNYYMMIYHRNHLGVATSYQQAIVRGSTVSYDFTTDSAKTFGYNVFKVSTSPDRWGMIPGDANRDGFIDAIDQFIWQSQNGLDGYLDADFNGDGFVDAIDQVLFWVRFNGLSSVMPCGFTVEPGSAKKIKDFPEYDKRNIRNDNKKSNMNNKK